MKEEHAEIIKLLELALYALPKVSETIKQKSIEFVQLKERGVSYSHEQLIDDAMKGLGELLDYFISPASKQGMLGKMIAKRASSYFAKSLFDTLSSSVVGSLVSSMSDYENEKL